MSYLIIAICVLFFSFFLFRRAAGSMSLRKLNLVSWIFYFEFFLQGWISAVLVVYGIDEHYLISKVNSDLARLYGYSAIMYMLIAFPIGMLLANALLGFNGRKGLIKFIEAPISTSFSLKDSYIRVSLIFLSLLSFLTIIYTFYTIGTIPLFKMFSGTDSLLLATMRIDAKQGFEGNSVLRNVFGSTLTPILCYISYTYYRYSKNRKDLIWFILLLILTVLILTYSLEKSPLIFFFIGFMFLKVYLDGGIKRKTIIFIGVGCFMLVIALYSFLSESFSLQELNNFRTGVFGRVLLGQSTGVYLTFNTYPDVENYIGLKSLSQNILDFIGLEQQDRSSRVLIERYNPYAVELGSAGVINSFFIAEAFANFGWTGVAIAPVYVGFLVQCMYVFFLTRKKTPIILGLFTYYSYKGGISGGFNEYIYNPGLFLIICVIMFAYFFAGYLKTTKKHSI